MSEEKNLFHVKRIDKLFSILYFLINEEKEFRKSVRQILMKNINALHRWSTEASKVGGKQSPLKFFSVNILYGNSFTPGPDLFLS